MIRKNKPNASTSKDYDHNYDHFKNLSDKQIDKLLTEIDIQFRDLLESLNFDEILDFLEKLPKSAADHKADFDVDSYLNQFNIDKMLANYEP